MQIYPFTNNNHYNPGSIKIKNSYMNFWLKTTDGNLLFDGMSGLWNVNLGYSNNAAITASQNQMWTLPYYNNMFGNTHEECEKLAITISNLLPDRYSTFFCNSGSEANDSAIKLIWNYFNIIGKPNKKLIITREYAYHGSTALVTNLSHIEDMHSNMDMPYSERFIKLKSPYSFKYKTKENHYYVEEFKKIIENKGAENIAAIFIEPIQGAGGVIIPPHYYLKSIYKLCKKYDILFVSDEIICGFGRTGEWFGFSKANIFPDIVVMGKGLSSGYSPISAMSIRYGKFLSTILGNGVLQHGFTYSGHPVSCAIASAVIQYTKDNLIIDNIRNNLGPLLSKLLLKLQFDYYSAILETRSEGLMCAIELNKELISSEDLKIQCIKNGLITRSIYEKDRNILILAPPLIITRKLLKEIVNIIDKSIKELLH